MSNEFEALDAFLELLNQRLSEERVQILNPGRIAEVEKSFKQLPKIVLSVDPDAIITYDYGPLNDGSISIRIEAREIIVYHEYLAEFIESIKNASNFEIYPLTNGKIRMAVMFYNCMIEL